MGIYEELQARGLIAQVTDEPQIREMVMPQLDALAEELLHGGKSQEETAKKGWVCGLCGYVYEGETLPEGFACPVCHAGAEKFEPLK